MIFAVLHSVLFDNANLCFFDESQPVVAQFELVIFASWQKKEKKPDAKITWKGKNMGP